MHGREGGGDSASDALSRDALKSHSAEDALCMAEEGQVTVHLMHSPAMH